jgi:cell division transport system permease protein
MIRYFQKALADIRSNRFLNLITMVTISLSILMVSLCLLVFENLGRIMDGWNQEGRAMVYLVPEFSTQMRPELASAITHMDGVVQVTFVSKDQALARLKNQMAGSTRFLDTLKENPLPHAFEIQIQTREGFESVAAVVRQIESLDLVESVEYNQKWLARMLDLFQLFRLIGYVVCALFLLIAFFITASTVRLVFHSRQSEVEIMRLVGATDRFIKMPFYVTGLIQGAVGGILGLMILFAAYLAACSGISQSMGNLFHLDVRFLSVTAMGGIWVVSTFLGWFGCYLSLRQLLK